MAKFKPGKSGNPGGRPRGSNTAKVRALAEFVSDDDLQGVLASVVGAAKSGDVQAAALILDRTIPKLRPRVADVADEAALAEEVAAARVRAAKAGGVGLGLESLICYEIVTGVPAASDPPARAPIAPGVFRDLPNPVRHPEPAPAAAPEPAPVRPLRMPQEPEHQTPADYDSNRRWLD